MNTLLDDTFSAAGDMATHDPEIGGPWTVVFDDGYGSSAADLVVASGVMKFNPAAPSPPTFRLSIPQRPFDGAAFEMEMDVKGKNPGTGGGRVRLVIDMYPGSSYVQWTLQSQSSSSSGPPSTPSGASVFWEVTDSLGFNQLLPVSQAVTIDTFYNLKFSVAADRMTLAFYLNGVLVDNVTLANPLDLSGTPQTWGISFEDPFKNRFELSRVQMRTDGSPLFWTGFVKTTETA
jgi:hypothetical protein